MSATCLHFMNSGDDQNQQPTTWPAIVRGSGIHPRIPMEGWAEEQPSAAGPPLGAHPPQQCRWCSTETTEVGWQEMEDWETHSSLPGKLWNCPRELATRWEVQLRNSHFRSPPWPASLVGRKFLRLFFSPVPRALHITKHYGKNHNQIRKALHKDSKLVHHNEYMMMPFLSFKNSIAIRLWSRSFSWKLL